MGYTIGIDVGGTFTDLVYTGGDGMIHVVKTPTTSENQAKGVLLGLEKLASRENLSIGELLKKTDIIVHGTTVVTNTMLEFKGARTGLITTRGFRDDIELRRGFKEHIFNPRYPAPVPIVKRRFRHTVNERIDREGRILIPLDDSEVIEVVRRLKDAGIESIGVCLFFGFLNPVHEKRIAEIIRQEHPDALISLSHEVLPQIREFERVSTTLVNAYTAPRLKTYLESLESELQGLGFENEFFVMLSSGGIMNAAYAAKYPVYSLLSGPAGGVVACSQLMGELLNEPNLITVDMGGTSYDVSLIRGGKPAATSNYWFSRYRVAVPMLDIHTIGTGGGSIAWVDSGGALQVGPRSAGAEPGPACYGKGGNEPTVTDANLLLGYLNPEYFLGGEIRLDRGLAEKAIEEKVARPLGFNTVQAAYGISRIVNNNMANGIRVVSVQKGYDPRDFVLVAFGGNGAVHAGVQARDLRIKKVIVPRIATAFSARGMLSSNIVINKVRTYMGSSDHYDLNAVNSLYSEMRNEVKREMPVFEGKDSQFMGGIENRYYIDMHYKGETHEITVPVESSDSIVGKEDIEGAVNAFHSAHETLHTFANPDAPAYFMNLRVETIIHTEKPPVERLKFLDKDPSSALKSKRKVYFEEMGGFIETPIYNGSLIHCGNVLKGPCVVEEPATTIVVYPGQVARLTEFNNYEISIK